MSDSEKEIIVALAVIVGTGAELDQLNADYDAAELGVADYDHAWWYTFEQNLDAWRVLEQHGITVND